MDIKGDIDVWNKNTVQTIIMNIDEYKFPSSRFGVIADQPKTNRDREEILKHAITLENKLVEYHLKQGRNNRLKQIAWNIMALIILFLIGVGLIVLGMFLVDLIKENI